MSFLKGTAPTERVNIVYETHEGDETAQVELPLRILVLGDFGGPQAPGTLEERKPVAFDHQSFDSVMAQHGLRANITVTDRIGRGQEKRDCSLRFRSLDDFSPEGIARQIPSCRTLLQLREALHALKGPLGNNMHLRRFIEELLCTRRDELKAELRLLDETGEAL